MRRMNSTASTLGTSARAPSERQKTEEGGCEGRVIPFLASGFIFCFDLAGGTAKNRREI